MSTDLEAMVLDDARQQMVKLVVHTRQDFAGIRTGRAAPARVQTPIVDSHRSEGPAPPPPGLSAPRVRPRSAPLPAGVLS
mgnify:CR=1 FL=1